MVTSIKVIFRITKTLSTKYPFDSRYPFYLYVDVLYDVRIFFYIKMLPKERLKTTNINPTLPFVKYRETKDSFNIQVIF